MWKFVQQTNQSIMPFDPKYTLSKARIEPRPHSTLIQDYKKSQIQT